MSMICWLLGVTQAQIGALRAAPSPASDLARTTPERYREERLAEMLKQMPPEKLAELEARRQAQLAQMSGFKEAQRRPERADPLEPRACPGVSPYRSLPRSALEP